MRTFKRIVTLLVAGFLLNALVALAVAASVNIYDDPASGGFASLEGVHWAVHANDGFGIERVISIARPPESDETEGRTEHFIPGWLDLDPPTRGHLGSAQQRRTDYLAVGWPMRSAWCVSYRADVEDGQITEGGVDGGAALPLPPWMTMSMKPRPRVFPLRPIWLGLLLNTVCFGLVAGAFGLAIDGCRELFRFRRGCCPACRHDLRFDYSQGCADCGWTVREAA